MPNSSGTFSSIVRKLQMVDPLPCATISLLSPCVLVFVLPTGGAHWQPPLLLLNHECRRPLLHQVPLCHPRQGERRGGAGQRQDERRRHRQEQRQRPGEAGAGEGGREEGARTEG